MNIVLNSDADYLSLLTRKIFHSGFNKDIVNQRWTTFEQVFHSFEPTRVAVMDEVEILAACGHPGMVRNGRKIRATIRNAQHFVAVATTHGSWTQWLTATSHLPYEQTADSLCACLAQCGPNTAFYFLLEAGFASLEDKPEGVK